MLSRTCISIPYGSIKRERKVRRKFEDIWFQFLMVQLKGRLQDALSLFSVFQFLMVQLKGMLKGAEFYAKQFQFLMVQLKEKSPHEHLLH